MTEPTSHFFIARVGAAAPDLESRLVQWASSSCQAHCVVRDGDGRVALYLHRKESNTARATEERSSAHHDAQSPEELARDGLWHKLTNPTYENRCHTAAVDVHCRCITTVEAPTASA